VAFFAKELKILGLVIGGITKSLEKGLDVIGIKIPHEGTEKPTLLALTLELHKRIAPSFTRLIHDRPPFGAFGVPMLATIHFSIFDNLTTTEPAVTPRNVPRFGSWWFPVIAGYRRVYASFFGPWHVTI
jgi:hypothetical protein